MPDNDADLIRANKQLREERDHYKRALMYLAETLAASSNKPADTIYDDALFETAHG